MRHLPWKRDENIASKFAGSMVPLNEVSESALLFLNWNGVCRIRLIIHCLHLVRIDAKLRTTLACPRTSVPTCSQRLGSETGRAPSNDYSYQLQRFARGDQCPMATSFEALEQVDSLDFGRTFGPPTIVQCTPITQWQGHHLGWANHPSKHTLKAT